jgi:hypothetical protein
MASSSDSAIRKINVAVVFSFLVSSLMLYVAWRHNSQCEFHCSGSIQWSNMVVLFFSWFVPVFCVSYVALLAISFIFFRKRYSTSDT